MSDYQVFLLPHAVAKRLGISRASVRNYATSGRLKVAGLTQEGYRLFSEEEVERVARELVLNPPPKKIGRPPKKKKVMQAG